MPGPESQETARALTPANVAAWGGAFGAVGIGLHRLFVWVRSPKASKSKGVSHTDFEVIKTAVEGLATQVGGLVKKVDALKDGQEERGQEMAVIKVTMATKEDLAKAAGMTSGKTDAGIRSLDKKIDLVLAEFHVALNRHLTDHAKGDFN